MPHVSSRKINKKILEKIYSLLFSAVGTRIVSRKEQQRAFAELLTPTEKVMLGKRLAAISLLSKGESRYRVGKILQLSETTTAKFQSEIDEGNFKHTQELCRSLEKGPLQSYIENLLKPLPRYGTSPSQVFRDRL